jgi:hypothetical protein
MEIIGRERKTKKPGDFQYYLKVPGFGRGWSWIMLNFDLRSNASFQNALKFYLCP